MFYIWKLCKNLPAISRGGSSANMLVEMVPLSVGLRGNPSGFSGRSLNRSTSRRSTAPICWRCWAYSDRNWWMATQVNYLIESASMCIASVFVENLVTTFDTFFGKQIFFNFDLKSDAVY